ncbi:hypothetical protein Tco_1002637 [Tanacetum coccineum]|uniref:Uncharacterized protein n=1 Tax=Tanacetum coccineum TaxID=301880 RepID=A0ABQ5F7X2_9ASTR
MSYLSRGGNGQVEKVLKEFLHSAKGEVSFVSTRDYDPDRQWGEDRNLKRLVKREAGDTISYNVHHSQVIGTLEDIKPTRNTKTEPCASFARIR